MPAKDVRVGDLILTGYHWRTWRVVTAVKHHRPICERDPSVMIDNTQCRTSWHPNELVACKRVVQLDATGDELAPSLRLRSDHAVVSGEEIMTEPTIREPFQRVQIVSRRHPHFEEYGRFTGHIVTMKFGTREAMAEVKLENCRHGSDGCFVSKGEVKAVPERDEP